MTQIILPVMVGFVGIRHLACSDLADGLFVSISIPRFGQHFTSGLSQFQTRIDQASLEARPPCADRLQHRHRIPRAVQRNTTTSLLMYLRCEGVGWSLPGRLGQGCGHSQTNDSSHGSIRCQADRQPRQVHRTGIGCAGQAWGNDAVEGRCAGAGKQKPCIRGIRCRVC
jgi:hypothetical protein